MSTFCDREVSRIFKLLISVSQFRIELASWKFYSGEMTYQSINCKIFSCLARWKVTFLRRNFWNCWSNRVFHRSGCLQNIAENHKSFISDNWLASKLDHWKFYSGLFDMWVDHCKILNMPECSKRDLVRLWIFEIIEIRAIFKFWKTWIKSKSLSLEKATLIKAKGLKFLQWKP